MYYSFGPDLHDSERKRKYDHDENVIEMNRMIKFGTNVDLSSELWDEQISEIDKLPWWLKLTHKANPMSQGLILSGIIAQLTV